MIYRITIVKTGEGKDRKIAHPVRNREELMALRNSKENLELLAKARSGDEVAKGKLLQLAYNIGHVEGLLAGCKSQGSFFFHDVDCYDAEQSQAAKELILSKKEEIGLMMLEKSVGGGWHLVCRRVPGTTILENQVRVAMALRIEMDTNTKDLQRVCFSTSGSEEDLVYLDDGLFEEPMSTEVCEQEYKLLKERERKRLEQVPKGAKKANKHYRPWEEDGTLGGDTLGADPLCSAGCAQQGQTPCVETPCVEATERTRFVFRECMKEEDVTEADLNEEGGRHNSVKVILSHCNALLTEGETLGVLKELMPDNWNDRNIRDLVSAYYTDYYHQNQRLTLFQKRVFRESKRIGDTLGTEEEEADVRLPKMPQGVKESIEAVGSALAMPTLTAICPCIGALATGVVLDVHGKKRGLNLIAYIAGDFASGKGDIDPVVDAWMSEVMALDKMYKTQEDEWRAKKLAAKNKKEQPEEPKLPVRCLTLNNTVANLAERLANTEGKHAFSFTPEADTVAQKWKNSVSDFSIMLRQSYDGSRYDREARSVEAVNVHIDRLLWNVTMCGTPDALYRVVSNYTDGFQSRIAVARTPDNTFTKLEDKPHVLTPKQEERIRQIAHLLPLMYGDVVLPKLEECGRRWLEKIRIETMKNDDKVKARQRFRVCVTAQRMTCCLMLCKVCETLIQKHGLNGAETQLKQDPGLWKELLLKAQTAQMMAAYDVIADSLMENALHFFRERIENAFSSRDYAGGLSNNRLRRGKNDSIFERLDTLFSYEQAMQHSVAVKGASVTHNSVQQMLKNWRKQELIEMTEDGKYRKK